MFNKVFRRPIRLQTVFALVLIAFAVLAGPGLAQDAGISDGQPGSTLQTAEESAAPASSSIDDDARALAELRQDIQSLQGELAELTTRANTDNVSDDTLVQARLDADRLSQAVLLASQGIAPRLREINTRLDQLGPVPGEGQSEPEVVTQERQRLNEEKAAINLTLGDAETLAVRAADLVGQIGALRRSLFTERLAERVSLSSALSVSTLTDLGNEITDLRRSFRSWIDFTLRFKFDALMGALATVLTLALAVMVATRLWITNVLQRHDDDGVPNYFTRLFSALVRTVVPALAVAGVLAGGVWIFEQFNIWRDDIRQIVIVALQVLWAVAFIALLAHAVFSPKTSGFRLVDVNDAAASRLVWIAGFVGLVSGLDFGLARISETLSSPVSLTVARSFFAVILVGAAFCYAAFLRPFSDEQGEQKPWPRWVRQSLLVAGFVPIAAALFGYVSLARFASQQIVVTGAILLTMYIGYLSAGAMSADGGFSDSVIGRRVRERLRLDEAGLDRLGVGASLLTYIVVTLIGLPLILLQWGYQPEELRLMAGQYLNEITIGSITISLSAILFGVLAFLLGLWLTRRFQGWLDGSVLKRGRMDTGVRTSIRTAVGYAGVAIAGLIGVSVAGFNLSSLALVAGALSLGIGFGLQNIVSNFVSGLILLAERPFKEGDWIVAGNVSGFVKKVSVRATEIETFQRQTILLPNSELINSAVGNWTHRNMIARLEIAVGVGYGSDVVKVQDILKEIALDHPKVLRNPEPIVLFKDFGASSLDFELRIFLPDLFEQIVVQSEIRTTITQRFREEGIEIPFPQRDINFKFPTEMAGTGMEEKVADALRARAASKRKSEPGSEPKA